VTNDDSVLDLFDEEEIDARSLRRQYRPQASRRPKRSQHEIVAEVADASGLEAGFNITYKPSRYEEGWLLSSLRGFYDQHLITDVQAQVKGGKEASVYRCAAHPSTGLDLVAAKVYRPRQFRNLRNDKMYREGRAILTADGRPVKETDHRLMRALGKKTAFGVQVAHTSWLMYEFTTLGQLFHAGAAVPEPIATGENAILMSYYGDARRAAPALNEIDLPRGEAALLLQEVLRNVDLLLQHGLIHGDLSAYNILYWEGRLTIIDFPQVTSMEGNSNAYTILHRDVTRVCEYFAAQGVPSDPDRLTSELWARYAVEEPSGLAWDIMEPI
jgi:RIO kinase 1